MVFSISIITKYYHFYYQCTYFDYLIMKKLKFRVNLEIITMLQKTDNNLGLLK